MMPTVLDTTDQPLLKHCDVLDSQSGAQPLGTINLRAHHKGAHTKKDCEILQEK